MNSARKATDVETTLPMVVVNRYIKVVVQRIFPISAVIIYEISLKTFTRKSRSGSNWDDQRVVPAITAEIEKILHTTTLIYLFTTTMHDMVSTSVALRALFKDPSNVAYTRDVVGSTLPTGQSICNTAGIVDRLPDLRRGPIPSLRQGFNWLFSNNQPSQL